MKPVQNSRLLCLALSINAWEKVDVKLGVGN